MTFQYLPHRNDQDFFWILWENSIMLAGKGANYPNVLGRTRVQLPFFTGCMCLAYLLYYATDLFHYFFTFPSIWNVLLCLFFPFPFCSVCLSSLNKWRSCLETAESSSVAGLSSLSNILRTQHPCHQFCNRLFCLNLSVFSPQYV